MEKGEVHIMSAQQIKCPHCNQVFDLSDDMAAHIRDQVRTKEFDDELEGRIKIMKETAEADTKNKVQLAILNEREKYENQLKKANNETSNAQIKIAELTSELRMTKESAAKNLDLQLKQNEMELKEKHNSEMSDIKAQLKARELELNYYKDLKGKLSNKLVGESLEKHCEIEFNKIRMAAFPNAEFGKDNIVSQESGSKGDYIFREYDDSGAELLSIMFEMKNEMTSTEKKKLNENFFKELDKDRKEKKCEYAVLVSLLEAESELYNQGIVDVSYAYPKMYVIRPQFFIPMITLLRNAALNTLDSKRELQNIKSLNMDITAFKENFEVFKTGFANNCRLSNGHMDKAIDEITKAIKNLEGVRDYLEASRKQLNVANKKASEITVEKLCKDSDSLLDELKNGL